MTKEEMDLLAKVVKKLSEEKHATAYAYIVAQFNVKDQTQARKLGTKLELLNEIERKLFSIRKAPDLAKELADLARQLTEADKA